MHTHHLSMKLFNLLFRTQEILSVLLTIAPRIHTLLTAPSLQATLLAIVYLFLVVLKLSPTGSPPSNGQIILKHE